MSPELKKNEHRSYPQYCYEINCPHCLPEHFGALAICSKSKEEIDPKDGFKCPLDNSDN